MALHRIEREDLIAQRLMASQLDLSSRKRVSTDLSGTHLSGFRGRGMEFEEHRAYVPGDEIRSIDWRVTARTGQTHVRSYREERERPINLAIDLRQPMWFGSQGCFKAVLAARAAARFAWAAAGNSDRVGGLCLHQHGQQMMRPAGGRRGALRLIGMLADVPEPTHTKVPALHSMLEELRRVARPGALIVVISDFHDLDKAAQQSLSLIARHCELILGLVSDPLERHPPRPGLYPTRNAADNRDSGNPQLLDTRQTRTRQDWEHSFQQRLEAINYLALQCRARSLDLRTERSLDESMSPFQGLAA
ncbi:MAG: DUF58 domain-containing protein [Oceanococcus sp.]